MTRLRFPSTEGKRKSEGTKSKLQATEADGREPRPSPPRGSKAPRLRISRSPEEEISRRSRSDGFPLFFLRGAFLSPFFLFLKFFFSVFFFSFEIVFWAINPSCSQRPQPPPPSLCRLDLATRALQLRKGKKHSLRSSSLFFLWRMLGRSFGCFSLPCSSLEISAFILLEL